MGDIEPDKIRNFILSISGFSLSAYGVTVAVAFARDAIFSNAQKRRGTFKYRSYKTLALKFRRNRVIIDAVRLSINLAICILYVYSTYLRNIPRHVSIANQICASFFTMDLLYRMKNATSAFRFVLSLSQFLSIMSLPSLFLARGRDQFLHFGYLRVFSVYDSVLRLEKSGERETKAARIPFKYTAQLSALFFALAAGIQMLEVPTDILGEKFSRSIADLKDWSFFNSIWFIIVTLSTVGYGDFSPKTLQGRLYTIFVIIAGINAFKNVITYLENRTKRSGKIRYRKRTKKKHVIVCGTPTIHELARFINEFYSDINHCNRNTDIVVVSEKPRWGEMEWHQIVLTNHFFRENVTYINGEFVSKDFSDLAHEDEDILERVGMKSADAVFILNSPSCDKREHLCDKNIFYGRDEHTLLIALVVRNFRTDIPIFSQTLTADYNLPIRQAMKTSMRSDKVRMYYDDVNPSANTLFGYKIPPVLLAPLKGKSIYYRQYRSGQFFRGNAAPRYVCAHKALKTFEKQSYVHPLCGFNGKQVPRNLERAENDKFIDLSRSRHICLQRFMTALSAANIKANGVATLCTNMFFDIGEDRKSKLPWLKEYQMGSQCSLISSIIPKYLNMAKISEIASNLYRQGISIIGVQGKKELKIKTILSTKFQLKSGDIGIFLTYLSPVYLRAALQIVSFEYANGLEVELSRNFKQRYARSYAFTHPTESLSEGAKIVNDSDHLALSLSSKTSTTELSPSVTFESDDKITDSIQNLKNHVIVAFESGSPLQNLSYFLKLLQHNRRNQNPSTNLSDVVVIIHPKVNYQQLCNIGVCFIEGDPGCEKSWNKANISAARAIVTFSDITESLDGNDEETMRDFSYFDKKKKVCNGDAKTIRTLLVLDQMTTPEQNIFICSELIDENSLEYLREPSHARRKGARLGRLRLTRSITLTDMFSKLHGLSNEHKTHETDNEVSEREYEDIEDEATATDKILRTSQSDRLASNHFYENRKDRTSLFARVRYTSGELLVYSTADALLVREYSQPGFIDFITGLLGANKHSPGQKIVLLDIPEEVFTGFAHFENGKRSVEYGVVYEMLISIGVTPLGLYRSGKTAVKIPKIKRKTQRELFLKQHIDMMNGKKAKNHWSFTFRTKTNHPNESFGDRHNDSDSFRTSSELSRKYRESFSGSSQCESTDPVSERSTGSKNCRIETFNDARNILPYVYTMPESYTLVAETDAVFVLCDPFVKLPELWGK